MLTHLPALLTERSFDFFVFYIEIVLKTLFQILCMEKEYELLLQPLYRSYFLHIFYLRKSNREKCQHFFTVSYFHSFLDKKMSNGRKFVI